jgi:DNA-directed RNA polymerase subunit RPC12/RpoP
MGLEIADVFRRFGEGYRARHGAAMPPSHRRAIDDITRCRTKAMGGHRYRCADCGKDVFAYHGCRNRSCPSCHVTQTREWLEARQAEILPCEHFHVTVTIPGTLRDVFRKNQKTCYALLMKVAAGAVADLCRDPKHLGATPGLLAVLHTWTGRMDYHPHVHLLATAGGVSDDGLYWRPSKPGFLVPVRALSRLVRGRLAAALAEKHPALHAAVPATAWREEWVASILPWGGGRDGVLAYLARYVFRIAITSARLVSVDDTHVTFKWKDRKQSRWRICRVAGEEFLRRFLQHVPPRGFHKVRYYGLWHFSRRGLAARARMLLSMDADMRTAVTSTAPGPCESTTAAAEPDRFRQCPHCGGTRLTFAEVIERVRNRSP